MLQSLKIKTRIMVAFLLVSLLPLGVVTFLSVRKAEQALHDEVVAKFTSVQEVKKNHLQDFFKRTKTAVRLLKEDPFLHATLESMHGVFVDNKGIDNDSWRLMADFRGERLKKLVADNGWSDLYLIGTEGSVVYTSLQKADLGLNLVNSRLNDTNLGKAFKQLFDAKADRIVMADFEAYAPYEGRQAAFILSRLESRMSGHVGYFAVQLSADPINAIIQQRSGMGKTAESYLVGKLDGKTRLRSDRVLRKQRAGEPCSDRYIDMALRGESGNAIRTDENGNDEFVRFDPVKLDGLNWCLITTGRVEEIFGAVSALRNNILMLIAAVVAMVIGLAQWMTGRLTRPINDAVAMIKDIAEGEGDLTKRLPVTGRDEIGVLAQWFNIFMEKLQTMIRQISEDANRLNQSSVNLSTIAGQMSAGAENAASRSDQVAVAAEEMNANLRGVAAASEQAASNVDMVAKSVEEMTATIIEIAKNSENARAITGSAVSKTDIAGKKIDELGRAANDIGKVTEVITEISEQTNLLALNATIEAARAGEAGKGFAVVANEIKELARQTAQATQEIKSRIQGIQGSTVMTVGDIGRISVVINDVSRIVETIATAVEEQATTSREIAVNVSQASQGIQEINRNVNESSVVSGTISGDIAEVNASVRDISASGGQVNLNAEELSALSRKLDAMVGKFQV